MVTSSFPSDQMRARRPAVIAVGGSKCSQDVLRHFFKSLPSQPDAAVIVVGDHSANWSQSLLEMITDHTALSVEEVAEPTIIQSNRVYLPSPDQHVVLRRDVLEPAERRNVDRDGLCLSSLLHSSGRASIDPLGVSLREGTGTAHLYVLSGREASEGDGVALLVLEDEDLDDFGDEESEEDPRVRRLEAELRETRKELGSALEEHRAAQHRLQALNEQIQSANQELKERSEQVRALSEALTVAEESERTRLSQVLHDHLQQLLYAARTKLDLLSSQVSLGEREGGVLSRSIDMLEEGIETTRSLSAELNPPVDTQSLQEVLEWLTFQMQEAYGLSVAVKIRGELPSVEKSLRLLVFRLVRELLFNVVKHAETDEALLELIEGEAFFQVIVEDKGKGFHPKSDSDREEGVGLVSVRDRLELLGGRFEVDSAPGEGTRVTISVPTNMHVGND